MIVDTSAIMAILLREPERETFARLIAGDMTPRWSTASAVELQAVLTRRFGGERDVEAKQTLSMLRLTSVPVSVEQSRIARIAYRTYGIGTQHPARLNFGDCFAYALSKATGEPLLFKGDDFAATDVVAAIPAKGPQPAV